MTRRLSLLLLGLALAAPAAHAQAPWNTVRRYLQPGAQVVTETPDRLVIEAEGQRLVLALEGGPGVDVYGVLARNRDGNPYRVWRATRRLWNDAARPRAGWGRFLRADFLRIVRPPEGLPDSDASVELPAGFSWEGWLAAAASHVPEPDEAAP